MDTNLAREMVAKDEAGGDGVDVSNVTVGAENDPVIEASPKVVVFAFRMPAYEASAIKAAAARNGWKRGNGGVAGFVRAVLLQASQPDAMLDGDAVKDEAAQ